MSSIQILMTADNHLDPSAINFGYRRFERRRDHLRCFEEAVEFAKRNKPDLFLISGDLFDSVRPSNIVRARLMNHFKDLCNSGIRIFMVGGHHDTPKSVEEGASPMAVYGNSGYAFFFHSPIEPGPFITQIRGVEVAIYGVSHDHLLQPENDPLSRVTLKREGQLAIMLTHYPIEGFEGYAGFEPKIRLSSIPSFINLIAGGHFHNHQVKKVGLMTVIYPGSTERASFAEEGEDKGFVWLELSREGVVSMEFTKTSARKHTTLEMEFPDVEKPMEAMRSELAKHADPQLILRLRLKGKVSVERLARYRRAILTAYAQDKFFHFDVDTEQLFIETPRPVEPLPRATPLGELRRYFEDAISKKLDEKEVLEEALRLSESLLEEAGAT